MVDDVGGFNHMRSTRLILTRVQVAIESREVAAGNLEPEFVPCKENVARGPKINGNVVDAPGISKFRFLLRIAIAQAQNTFGQILSKSVGPDINQFPGEVCVDGGTADIEVERNWPRNFSVLCKCRRREYKHIVSRFCGSLVLRANSGRQRLATKGPSNRRDCIVRIIYILVWLLIGRRSRTQRATPSRPFAGFVERR